MVPKTEPEYAQPVFQRVSAAEEGSYGFRSRLPVIAASDGYVFTAPVEKFKPNAFGLYDMHGNACQWCADWYGDEYYAKSPVDNPTGPETGDVRVLRGGSWNCWPGDSRSASRLGFRPDYRDLSAGFRVARTP
jgi:formylglycine-generating enzyme required for sulfatase activity